jgi:hypothetical protein
MLFQRIGDRIEAEAATGQEHYEFRLRTPSYRAALTTHRTLIQESDQLLKNNFGINDQPNTLPLRTVVFDLTSDGRHVRRRAYR